MKKIVSFIVCFALLVVLCPVFFTQDAEACGDITVELREQGYEFKEIGDYHLAVKGDEAVLIHLSRSSRETEELTFDSEVGGYRIVQIWNLAFETAGFKRIVIPEGIVQINNAAFEQCRNLEEVVLPSTLRVLGKAFTNCPSLKRIVIPEGMETISGTIAYYCETLEEVVLPSTLRRIDGLLEGCPMIETVVLPEGLETIGGPIFYDCENVKTVEIPASVIHMSSGPVSGENALKSITVAPGNSYIHMENGCLYTADGILLYGMEGCTLPAGGITAIGDNFFSGAKWLESLVIPDGVTSIGKNAFAGCTNLKEIVIPDSVTSIGYGAFMTCIKLQEVEIPQGVTTIEPYTFYLCYDLQKASLPEGLTEIGNFAFYYCESLTSAVVPESVTTVGESAFSMCEKLDVNLPSGLEIIGKSAFARTATTSAVIPDTVTELGESAFGGCSKLETFRFQKGVTSVPGGLLAGCSSLKELVVPEGVTYLELNSLTRLTGLEKLTLPSTLETIAYNAISYMPSLKELVFDWESTPYTLEKGCLTDGNGTLLKILMGHEIPDGIKTIGDYACYNYQSDEPLFLPEGVTSIGDSAFAYTEVPEIVLPYGLTYMGFYVFDYSTIESLFLPSSLEYVGSFGFGLCQSLRQLDIQGPKGTFADDLEYGYDGRIAWNVKERRTDIYKVSGDFRYEVVGGKAHIVGYLGDDTEVTVPAKIDGYTVTALGMSAFAGQTSITAIHLPNTLQLIEVWAFDDCHSLKELVIPKSVKTIKEHVAWNCHSLETIYIGFVTTIGDRAFGYCDNLKNIYCASPSPLGGWDEHWFGSNIKPEIALGVNYTNPHPDDAMDTPEEDTENPPAEDEVSGEVSTDVSQEISQEISQEASDAASEEVIEAESQAESSSPRTIPEEDAEEGTFPWGWIVAAVLVAGIGATIFFVRKKK